MNEVLDRGQFERYRLMLISTWPEGDRKRASLASAQAALQRELKEMQSDEPLPLKAAA